MYSHGFLNFSKAIIFRAKGKRRALAFITQQAATVAPLGLTQRAALNQSSQNSSKKKMKLRSGKKG